MKITLTPQHKLELEQMHDPTRDSRVCYRIKAVPLASEGWSQTMISQALRIHESTVARHLSDYILFEKLKPENGGSQSKLSATQTMHLIEHLTEKTKFSHLSNCRLRKRDFWACSHRFWYEQTASPQWF